MDFLRASDVRAIRERLGLTMSALAQELHCSVDLIVAWELGQKFPTRRHTEALLALDRVKDAARGQQI
jgi:DNA-binding transcriptional regulator YiaG